MMAYIDTETSNFDGNPIELYEFVGSYQTYRYTSYHKEVTFSSNVYTPIAISRKNLEPSVQDDENELKIELPATDQLVIDHGINAPPFNLELTIYRQHGESGDTVVYFKGSVLSFSISNSVIATITANSVVTTTFSGEVPSVYFQGQCNHVLGDSRCQVDLSGFRVDTTIVSIDGSTIVVSTVGAQTGTNLIGGRIRSGIEERLIKASSGTTLTINYPFTANVEASDACTLFAGCDHTVQTCRDRFSNVVNFGGYPHIPGLNPFQGNVV